jgi:hypothetical protein
MGSKKAGSGFWSAVSFWFACFGSAKASSDDSGRRCAAHYNPADGMVAAAKHFSSAHSVKFG